MAQKLTNSEIESILGVFLGNLESKVKIDKAILYGSYAKGNAHEWSDIDLLVISRELPLNKPKGANGFLLSKLAGFEFVYPGLEIIGTHPDKLSNEVTKSFYDEILNTGKEFDLETRSLKPIQIPTGRAILIS